MGQTQCRRAWKRQEVIMLISQLVNKFIDSINVKICYDSGKVTFFVYKLDSKACQLIDGELISLIHWKSLSFIGLEQGGYEWGHSSSRNAISANIIQKMDLQVHLQQRFKMLIRLTQRVWLCHWLRMCVLRFDWVVAKYYKVCCGDGARLQ